MPSSGPTARASKAVVAPGETISLSGQGFPASEQVGLTWFLGSGRRLDLGTAEISPAGSFSVRVTVPADVCRSRAGSVYVISRPTYAAMEVPLRVAGASC